MEKQHKKELWKITYYLLDIQEKSEKLGREHQRREDPNYWENPKHLANMEKDDEKHYKLHDAITASILAVLDMVKEYQKALQEQHQTHKQTSPQSPIVARE